MGEIVVEISNDVLNTFQLFNVDGNSSDIFSITFNVDFLALTF